MEAVISAIQPKKPSGPKWKQVPYESMTGYPALMFFHKPSKILVISAVEVASDAPGEEPICSYHISMTRNGKRRTRPEETRFALRAFDMEDSNEDNHVPFGLARNFWRPVNDNMADHVCPCQDTEPAMVEDKGSFVWRG